MKSKVGSTLKKVCFSLIMLFILTGLSNCVGSHSVIRVYTCGWDTHKKYSKEGFKNHKKIKKIFKKQRRQLKHGNN